MYDAKPGNSRSRLAYHLIIVKQNYYMKFCGGWELSTTLRENVLWNSSRVLWQMAYSGGINAMPTTVAKSIPEKVVTPIARRLAAPAPAATTNGKTPKINDQAVIKTARNRMPAAVMAES